MRGSSSHGTRSLACFFTGAFGTFFLACLRRLRLWTGDNVRAGRRGRRILFCTADSTNFGGRHFWPHGCSTSRPTKLGKWRKIHRCLPRRCSYDEKWNSHDDPSLCPFWAMIRRFHPFRMLQHPYLHIGTGYKDDLRYHYHTRTSSCLAHFSGYARAPVHPAGPGGSSALARAPWLWVATYGHYHVALLYTDCQMHLSVVSDVMPVLDGQVWLLPATLQLICRLLLSTSVVLVSSVCRWHRFWSNLHRD